jgi:hypothetical protein
MKKNIWLIWLVELFSVACNSLFAQKGVDLESELPPDAPGPVPYTILVAPGGKILYRCANEINVNELSAKIVDQLGAYYSPQIN